MRWRGGGKVEEEKIETNYMICIYIFSIIEYLVGAIIHPAQHAKFYNDITIATIQNTQYTIPKLMIQK